MIKQKRHFENLIGGRLIYFMSPEQAYKHYGRWAMNTQGIPFIAEVEEYMEKTVFTKRGCETKRVFLVALREMKTHRFLNYKRVSVDDPSLFGNYAEMRRAVKLDEEKISRLMAIDSIDKSIENICNQLKSYLLRNRPDDWLPKCKLPEVAKELKQAVSDMYKIPWIDGHDRLTNALSEAFRASTKMGEQR